MTITTAFNHGQEVFYPNKGNIRKANVSEIKTHTFLARNGEITQVSYILDDDYSITRSGETLFPTESEAQAALESSIKKSEPENAGSEGSSETINP